MSPENPFGKGGDKNGEEKSPLDKEFEAFRDEVESERTPEEEIAEARDRVRDNMRILVASAIDDPTSTSDSLMRYFDATLEGHAREDWGMSDDEVADLRRRFNEAKQKRAN